MLGARNIFPMSRLCQYELSSHEYISNSNMVQALLIFSYLVSNYLFIYLVEFMYGRVCMSIDDITSLLLQF